MWENVREGKVRMVSFAGRVVKRHKERMMQKDRGNI